MQERIAPICGCATTGKIVRGMCATHYDRWVHATPKELRGPSPRQARTFWDFVDKSGECWIWTGSRNGKGYGQWQGEGFKGLAHRYSLMQVERPFEGAFACHHCDNPPCVNPEHLYWGTLQQNVQDYVTRQGVHNKGIFKPRCPKGHLKDGANLRVVNLGNGNKKYLCRTCDNAKARLYQEARRAKAIAEGRRP